MREIESTFVLLSLSAPTVITVVRSSIRIQTNEVLDGLLQATCLTHTRLFWNLCFLVRRDFHGVKRVQNDGW